MGRIGWGSMGLFGNKNKEQVEGARAFADACRDAADSVSVLFRESDLYPIYISPAFERVFGVDAERLVDDVETLLRFIPDESRLAVKRQCEKWDRAEALTFRFPYLMPGAGTQGASARKHFRATLTPADGTIFASLVDVTSEQELIDEARAERDHALAVVESRADFMSQMSHEIRTPLNGIKGLILLAKDHAAEPDRLVDDLSRASELSAYLLSLINDVLDMSRLNSGHVELEKLPFDMRLVANDLTNMFEAQAKDKGLAFTVALEDCENVFLVGDRMRLNQVIVNFVSNALKFTSAGGQVSVTFREMYRKDDSVSYMIRVRDTGKGMDPRFISRIFKPFEQEDRTIARRFGGTGLGMAITSALVELAGGEIVVDTELGRGSDFTVYLPFDVATSEQIDQLASENATLETAAGSDETVPDYDFDGKRFLLAEDNELNAMIAEEIIGSLGVTVDVANDGPVVVDMFEKSEPYTYDAILMDIQMPTYSGWEATRRIRATLRPDAATVPIIALSANNYVEDARASREAGMNGHAGKPIEIPELKSQLAAAAAESAYRRDQP